MNAPRRLGPYLLEASVGRGAMGEVFRARAEDGTTVAVKIASPAAAGDPEAAARFLREGRLAATLDHPGVVKILATGRTDEGPYVVMEFIEGPSLKDRLRAGPMGPGEAVRIAEEAASALAHAHARGVVHRDIKPANLLLDPRGRVKVADFGLARALSDDPLLTRTGALVGTPCYMAPEQAFDDPGDLDGRVDVFSLGVVLHEMLSGRRAFEGATLLGTLRRLESEELPPAGAGEAVDRLLARATAKRPADRIESASEFAEALGRVRRGGTLPASRMRRPMRRAAALLLVAAAAVLGVALANGRSDAPPTGAAPATATASPAAPAIPVASSDHYRADFLRALDASEFLASYAAPGLFRGVVTASAGQDAAGVQLDEAVAEICADRLDVAGDRLVAATLAGAERDVIAVVRAHIHLAGATWEGNPVRKAARGAAARDALDDAKVDAPALRGFAFLTEGRLSDALREFHAAGLKSANEAPFFNALRESLTGNVVAAAAALEAGGAAAVDNVTDEAYLRLMRFAAWCDPSEAAPRPFDADAADLRQFVARAEATAPIRRHPAPGVYLLGALSAVLDGRFDELEARMKPLARGLFLGETFSEADVMRRFLWSADASPRTAFRAASEMLRATGRDMAATSALRRSADVPEDAARDASLRESFFEAARWAAERPVDAARFADMAMFLGAPPERFESDAAFDFMRRTDQYVRGAAFHAGRDVP